LKHFRSSLVGVKEESCTGSDQECTQAAAGLAPGRPDEGVWAYVYIAKLLQRLG